MQVSPSIRSKECLCLDRFIKLFCLRAKNLFFEKLKKNVFTFGKELNFLFVFLQHFLIKR